MYTTPQATLKVIHENILKFKVQKFYFDQLLRLLSHNFLLAFAAYTLYFFFLVAKIQMSNSNVKLTSATIVKLCGVKLSA